MYIRSPLGGRRGGGCEASGEWVGGRGWISHAYSRKYSRMKHFGASLTLNASYSLFSQSPVAKQHSVVLLGRLPTSLSSGKKERVNVSYNIVDRRSTKGANEKGKSCDLPFRWLPLLGSNHATLFRSAQRRVCFANVAQRNKLRNHDVLSVRVKQKKKNKSRPQMRSAFV